MLVKLVHWRLKFHRAKRRARPNQRFAPQSSVKKHFSGVELVIAWPLEAAHFFQTTVTHAGVHRAQRAHLIPNRFGIGRAPVVAEAASQVKNDLKIVTNAGRGWHGAADALHAALA